MKIINGIGEMQLFSKQQRGKGKTIGFVPTMGFLHEGHLSLVRKARKECSQVVVSIFVNPTQFGPKEDLDDYPRDFEADKALCEKENVDVIFYPAAEEMYNQGKTFVLVEELGNHLCGKSRPTHFKGVATVVAKLFNIVKPDKAFFGLKDAQQFAIIKKMASDLNFDLEIVPCPIVREADGLALSSRNRYLSKEQRAEATVLNSSLNLALEMFKAGEKNAGKIKQAALQKIEGTSGKVDYVEIVDFDSMQPVLKAEKGSLIALAVFFGNARLIDNRFFE